VIFLAKKPDYASLYTLRKDGRYTARDHNGKFLYDRDPEKLWHKLNDPKVEPPLLFKEIATSWYNDACTRLEESTMACYDANYNRAIERLGDTAASEIEASDIYAHLLQMKSQGYSASTIKKQRVVYKQVYQFAAITEKYSSKIRYNPAVNVKLPSGLPKPTVREAPEDEMVKKIKAGATTAYWGLFAMFLMCTGFRRGEALGVQWRDIDFKEEKIYCKKSISLAGATPKEKAPKTISGIRYVPLLEPLAAVLHRPSNAKASDFVFPGSDPSKPMPKTAYNRHWLHYCKDMGFVVDSPEETTGKNGRKYIKHHYTPTLTAHVLRHGYATVLFEADVDVYTAKKFLGHADIKTTMAIYTHLRERKKQESVKKLTSYIKTVI
jgi:integrase